MFGFWFHFSFKRQWCYEGRGFVYCLHLTNIRYCTNQKIVSILMQTSNWASCTSIYVCVSVFMIIKKMDNETFEPCQLIEWLAIHKRSKHLIIRNLFARLQQKQNRKKYVEINHQRRRHFLLYYDVLTFFLLFFPLSRRRLASFCFSWLKLNDSFLSLSLTILSSYYTHTALLLEFITTTFGVIIENWWLICAFKIVFRFFDMKCD